MANNRNNNTNTKFNKIQFQYNPSARFNVALHYLAFNLAVSVEYTLRRAI